MDAFHFFQAGCRFKPTFIHVMYKAPQTMFLCPGPLLKLLRGRLAAGGLSCGIAFAINFKMRQISTHSSPPSLCLELGRIEGVAIVQVI